MGFIRLEISILYLKRAGSNRCSEPFQPYRYADTWSTSDLVRTVLFSHTAQTARVFGDLRERESDRDTETQRDRDRERGGEGGGGENKYVNWCFTPSQRGGWGGE